MAVVTLAALLSACSAGHGGVTAPAPASTGGAKPAATRVVNLTLTIPDRATAAKRRLPAYVSSSTQSASVLVNPGALTSDASLTLGPNCVAVPNGRACTIPVSAPVGADTFAITLYDGPCSGGPPCTHSGTALSAASAFAATVTEGAANVTVPLVLGGIVDTVLPSIVHDPGPGPNAQHDLTITLTAKDHGGNTIVGPAPYVNAAGAAVPLVLAMQLSPTIDTADPELVLNGTPTPSLQVTVTAPTDSVALRVDAGGQPIVGTELRVLSGSTTLPGPFYYQAPGPASGSFGSTASYGVFLNNCPISVLGAAAFGQTLPSGAYAGSNCGWITNIGAPGGSNWASQASNTYCKLTAAATNVEGIGIDTSGNAYVTFFDGTHSFFTEVTRGSANAVTACNVLSGISPVIFGASGNLGGAVAVSPSTIFFVNHVTTALPAFDEEVDIATPGLGSPAVLLIAPGANSNGLGGAIVDPTDGSLWVVAHFADSLFHIVGTPGSPATYAATNLGGYGLGGCSPNGITTDGTLLYVSCSTAAFTKVITPNGGASAPTVTSLATAAGSGSVANFNDIAIGPDGFLWIQTGTSQITKFDRVSGASLVTVSGAPNLNNLVVGGDGDLWVSNSSAGSNVIRVGQGFGP